MNKTIFNGTITFESNCVLNGVPIKAGTVLNVGQTEPKGYYGPCPICEQAKMAKRLNDDALGEASWKLMECAGPSIPFNRLKDVAREVVKAYFASIERQAGFK